METDLAIMKMMRAAAAGEVAEEGEAKEVEEVEAADVAAEEEGIVLESREIDGTGTSTGISTGISTGGTGGWEYAICLTKSDKSGPKGIKRVVSQVAFERCSLDAHDPLRRAPYSAVSGECSAARCGEDWLPSTCGAGDDELEV